MEWMVWYTDAQNRFKQLDADTQQDSMGEVSGDCMEEMLTSGMFATFFELLLHRSQIQEAKLYLKQLRAFYTAGWRELFEIT